MRKYNSITAIKFFTAIVLSFVLFAIVNTGCYDADDWKDFIDTSHHVHESDSQVVILRKPGSTNKEFTKWLKWVKSTYGNFSIVSFCANCGDNSLMLLDGPGALRYIIAQGNTGGGNGSKPPGASGGDGPVYYSSNTFLISKDSADSSRSPGIPIPAPACSKPSVTVAVFDTGIDTSGVAGMAGFGNFIRPGTNETSCMGADANNGWNFAGNATLYAPNNNWNDDDPLIKHGTIVSRIILDRVLRAGKNCVNLLPVKVLRDDGTCTLYDLLCAFEYAKQRGAKIINASLGYYAPIAPLTSTEKDTCAGLLKEFIRTTLTKNNILLVCAAGNQHNSGITRNLDRINFYPASLSDSLDNVIAVTTVDETSGTPSDVQNYSNNIVDIGVNGDVIPGNTSVKYLFSNPLPGQGKTLQGSSFATPFVTAYLCANYYLIQGKLNQSSPVNKQDLIGVLRSASLVHRGSNRGIDSVIKNGVVLTR